MSDVEILQQLAFAKRFRIPAARGNDGNLNWLDPTPNRRNRALPLRIRRQAF